MTDLTRRKLLGGAVALSAAYIIPTPSVAGGLTPWPNRIGYDRLWIRNTNGEQLSLAHWNGRSYDASNCRTLSYLWRDWRDNDAAVMIDPRLFTYLANIQTRISLSARQPLQLILNSGYRTPRRNATLEGAARNSEHTRGRAGDFRVEGVRPSDVHKVAATLNPHGLGSYTNFTHLDVGGAGRRWNG